MATVADVLTVMGILDNEMDVSSGGADESRAIAALTMAQHQFDSIAASLPNVLGDTITIAPTANTEKTAWSTLASALLRIDAIWLLDATAKPIYKLKRIEEIGGHTPSLPWPLQVTLTSGTGGPRGYFSDMRNFYWLPLPDATYSCRIYGYLEQAEWTLRTSTYSMPQRCKNAFAEFAVRVLNGGVGDDVGTLEALGSEIFKPLMKGLGHWDRSEPSSRNYQYAHDT